MNPTYKTQTATTYRTGYAPADSVAPVASKQQVSPLQKAMDLFYGTIYGYEAHILVFGGLLWIFWLLYTIDFASIGSK